MKLSMLITSQNRYKELKQLVDSINKQKNLDFFCLQVIFIDQGYNAKAFEQLNKKIDFFYIKTSICSLSRARNLGLNYIKGDYICFPDDDCWFDLNTLSNILKELSKGLDGVVARGKSKSGANLNKCPDKEQFLTLTNHCGAFSPTFFIKYDCNIKFDERLGVGSEYGLSSGEETDYLYTYMEKHKNFRIKYLPNIIVRHPLSNEYLNYTQEMHKAYLYARGEGFLIRKHLLPFLFKLNKIIRPLGGLILYTITTPKKARRSFYILKGRLEGYFFKFK